MRSPVRVAAAAAILAILPACSFARADRATDVERTADSRVGDGVVLPANGEAGAPSAPAGDDQPVEEGSTTRTASVGGVAPDERRSGVVITVRGPDGRMRAGVPVSLAGGAPRSGISDETGVARFDVPPGRYTATVAPTCTDAIQVETGATARISIPEGEIVRGDLEVSARRRHFPGAPVTYEPNQRSARTDEAGRQWPMGVAYVVRFTMLDRCGGGVSGAASIEGLRIVSADALETRLQVATAAADDGTAAFAAICRAEAEELEVFAEDAANPSDRVDLFSPALLGETAPNCVR